jgi:hypothetical protein
VGTKKTHHKKGKGKCPFKTFLDFKPVLGIRIRSDPDILLDPDRGSGHFVRSVSDPIRCLVSTRRISQQFQYSVSDPDPHSIGFLGPDPGGVKSAEIEGENEAKIQVIHFKKLI